MKTNDLSTPAAGAGLAAKKLPAPPTAAYRLTQRGIQLYLVAPNGGGFDQPTLTLLRTWVRDAGYFASASTANELAVSESSISPPIDAIPGERLQATAQEAK